MAILIESPEEIQKRILGEVLLDFIILPNKYDEAYCADEEILMEFTNGKEMRIYINADGKLSVYTD